MSLAEKYGSYLTEPKKPTLAEQYGQYIQPEQFPTRSVTPEEQGTIGDAPTLGDRLGEVWDKGNFLTAPVRVASKLLGEGTRAGVDYLRGVQRGGSLRTPTQQEFAGQPPVEALGKATARGMYQYPLGIAEFLGTLPDQIMNSEESLLQQGKGFLSGAVGLPAGVPAMVSEAGKKLQTGNDFQQMAGGALRNLSEPLVGPANSLMAMLGEDPQQFEAQSRENLRTNPENLAYGVQIGKGVAKAPLNIVRGVKEFRRAGEQAKVRDRVTQNIAENRAANEATLAQRSEQANLRTLNQRLAESRAAKVETQPVPPGTDITINGRPAPKIGPERQLPAPPGYGPGFTFRDVRPDRQVVLPERAKQQVRAKEGNVQIPEATEVKGKKVVLRGPNSIVNWKEVGRYGAAGTALVLATTALATNDEDTKDKSLAGLGFLGLASVRRKKGEISALADIRREVGKVRPERTLNLNHINVDVAAKKRIVNAELTVAKELNDITGKKLSHEEIIQAAKNSEVLGKVLNRTETVKILASVEATRQALAKASESGTVTPELIDLLKQVRGWSTFSGRALNALKINSDPILHSTRNAILDKILSMTDDIDGLIKAAEKVDWKNHNQVTELYRKYVPATFLEKLDEYRYINLLSSPRTHIVNAFSNTLQGVVLRPSTLTAGAAIDAIGSSVSGAARQQYLRQVPAYYRGFFSSVGDASRGALKAFKGEDLLERPDVPHFSTNAKALKPFYFIPRALEAGDVFFRTMITEGEYASLAEQAKRSGKPFDPVEAKKQAEKTAEELVFRKTPDPTNQTGQGTLLSSIDRATDLIYKARSIKAVRWYTPFIMTPMNIFKQGIEYSPLGFLTLKGNKNPKLQLSKAMVGSTVFAGAAYLAASGRTTWAAPTGDAQKQLFYEAGMQPYSIKIGDKWYSYSKLGPLAYPIAMASAFRYHFLDQNKAMTKSEMDKIAESLGGIAGFFSDQSYVQGIGELLDATRGEPGALTKSLTNIPTQLIPLVSLQRWANTMIDPTYRKSEDVIDELQKSIVGLSKYAPAYTDSEGMPSKRQMPFVNAISPVGVRKADKGAESEYRSDLFARQREGVRSKVRSLIRDGRDREAEKLISSWNEKYPLDPVESYASFYAKIAGRS